MGIKHIDNLSYKDYITALSEPWELSEKLDGSSARIGILDNRYYLEYANVKYFSLDDFPSEIWASTYKVAFSAGIVFLSRANFSPFDCYFDIEILFNKRPNTIFYNLDDTIVLRALSINGGETQPAQNWAHAMTLKSLYEKLFISMNELKSDDGIKIETILTPRTIKFRMLESLASRSYCDIIPIINEELEWLNTMSIIPGFSNSDVILQPLTSCPHGMGPCEWKIIKPKFKELRQSLRTELDKRRMILKNKILDILSKIKSGYNSDFMEGVVVTTTSTVFKIVDKTHFTAINYYLHRVKYLLLGSKFYKKQGLLTIWKDYPKEVKIEKIHRLLQWYLRNHYKMLKIVPYKGKSLMYGYADQIHQRTLNMFADTIQRVENGR